MTSLPGRVARGLFAACLLSVLPFSAALAAQAGGLMETVDGAMGAVNGVISSVFFYDVAFWSETIRIPFVVIWLVVASTFLTVRMGFINLRAFKHALQVTAGKFTDPNAPGDVSHFQALTTALSATVGLGNIAGVAIAVSTGGPGATFWMIVAGCSA
jgi:alanine or glycine:cation symporter, AGCS family